MALVYSCCFWFSLRLGGILIGLWCLSILLLVAACIAYVHSEKVNEELHSLSETYNFIYSNELLEQFMTDPKKYISLSIGFTSVYIFVCILYIYGAYLCNNILMVGFIVMELIRLIIITMIVATVLLMIKENTMDIGVLIGASVIGGFFLLGMFYLWICATNLPILINEMERDEQAATIAKLQQILESSQRNMRRDVFTRYGPEDLLYTRNIGRNRGIGISTIINP